MPIAKGKKTGYAPPMSEASDLKTKMQQGRLEMTERCYRCALENTPGTVKAVFIRGSLSGRAYLVTGFLHAPRPKTRKALYIFLHECAHFALHHVGRAKPVHLIEYEAETWAHERMRAYGIPVPRKMTQRAKQYVARKIEKARRRGAKSIDAKAMKYAQKLER